MQNIPQSATFGENHISTNTSYTKRSSEEWMIRVVM